MREAPIMGRPREFDEDEALTAIMGVFWAKGFEGASLADLVAATGLKKGSLYAAFGDKRAMYHKALARYDRLWIDRAVAGLRGDGPPRLRIERFLRSAADASSGDGESRGCFLCNASIDQVPVDPEARQLVQASLQRLVSALADVVAESLAGDDADAPETALCKARHIMSVHFGLRVLANAAVAPAVLADAEAAALATLAWRSPGAVDRARP